MKKLIFLSVITLATILFNPTILYSQEQNVDSLINVLNTQKLSSEEQIALCMQICTFYNNYDNEKLFFYAQKGLAIAEKAKDKSSASRFNMIFGQVYCVEEKYDSAMIYYNKSVALAEQAGNKDLQGGAYTMIGSMYMQQSKQDIALDYSYKALSCLENVNRRKYGSVLGQIGQIHKALNNFDKAIEYLEQAKTIAEEVNFPNSIITVYYDLGSIYRMKGDRDKALEYALKALTISVEHRNKQYEIITPCLISSIYAELKNNDKAFEYAQQAVKTAEEYGEKRLIIAAMDALSRVYFNQKKYKECDDLARKAWEQDTLNDGPTGHNLIARLLFVNVQLGKTDDAMYFLEELQKILDHENDDNLHKNIAELEVKYETEKKELRIASLEKEKQLYIWLGIAGVTILLLVLGLSFFRHRMNVQKRKLAEQKIKQLEQEKQIIAAQSVLEGETEERKRVAEELHDGLGAMLSVVKLNLSDAEHIQNARDLLDRSISELRRIAHHMMPESLLRYGLKVSLEDFSLSVPNMKFHYFGDDSRLDNKMEALIYRCVHELVNNAIKYSGAENINVQLVRDDDRVSLTIQDDGCGFDSEIPTKGTGLKNLRNRVTTYNGTLNIYSSPGKGTEVYVDIPLKLK